jgi:hypothetical protein
MDSQHAATRMYAGGRELAGTCRWDVNVHADTGIVDSFPAASEQPKALPADEEWGPIAKRTQ